MPNTSANTFLGLLSTPECERLTANAVSLNLPIRTSLYEPDETPKYAYFITSGIASVVTAMADGGTAEVGLVGSEGMVGAIHILGRALVQTRCFIQSPATALQIRLSLLREVFLSSEEVRTRLLEFVQEQTLTVSQVAACNRLHGAEERLARWLLMVQDRIQSNTLLLTQEFLAEMLGAQRTTVTMVAGTLQEAGLIEYRRGKVQIVDRDRLREAACSCYPICHRLYAGLYSKA